MCKYDVSKKKVKKTDGKKEQMVFMMRLGEKKTLRRNSLGKLGRGEISHETTEQPDEERVEAEEDGRRMRGFMEM